MKFTEEQYQKIVEIADEYKINSCFGIIGDTTQRSIGEEFYETELVNEIDFYENAKEMMAIFNPLTREWAHEQFVEKEKKYVWHLKTNSNMIVSKTADDYWYLDRFPALNKEFTRIDIEKSPFNPEWFDKVEE